MAWYTGDSGELLVGATPTEVEEISNWSLNLENAAVENQSINDLGTRQKPGARSVTGEFTLNVDEADSEQSTLKTAWKDKTAIELVIRPRGSGSTLPEHDLGPCWILTWNEAGAANETLEAQVTFSAEAPASYDDTPQT